MNKIKIKSIIENNRYEFIIFFVDVVCMILELVASRVLSPYFGNSNIVWTSIIGIILLSGSIGNYLGGKIADRKNVNENLKIILGIASLLIFLIPIIQQTVLQLITNITSNIKIGAIFSTVLLFFMPSVFLGFITPIILKLKLNSLKDAGKTLGKLYAIATLGGIFGTFLGGFALVPSFGSIYILFVLAIVICALIPVVDLRIKSKINIATIFIIIISIILMNVYIQHNKKEGYAVLSCSENGFVSYDTQYGRVLIYNTKINENNARILNIDSGHESATYTEKDKRNQLVFEYAKYYDLMFKVNPNVQDTLMIGGAGYSYPKYYISTYLNKNIDVVEIDGDITKLAKEYFYLDDLIKDYNLLENHRLNLITDDGRVYVNNSKKKYDAILNDAFSGSSPAKTLTTVEAVTNIKNRLNEGGVYLTNIVSSLEGDNSKFLRAEVDTINKVFKNVYVIPVKDINNKEIIQNNMVIASDNKVDLEGTYNLLTDDKIILTDDYCPVDTLIPEIK